MTPLFVTNNPIALEHGPVERKHLHDRLRGVVELGRRGENLHSVLRHKQRVLELRRPLSVGRHHRPVVRPLRVVGIARIHHRLDREDHARTDLALPVVIWAQLRPLCLLRV